MERTEKSNKHIIFFLNLVGKQHKSGRTIMNGYLTKCIHGTHAYASRIQKSMHCQDLYQVIYAIHCIYFSFKCTKQ